MRYLLCALLILVVLLGCTKTSTLVSDGPAAVEASLVGSSTPTDSRTAPRTQTATSTSTSTQIDPCSSAALSALDSRKTFVQALYRDALERSQNPSADEVQPWIISMNQGVASGDLVQQIYDSTERRTHSIDDIYQSYLGRIPALTEVQDILATPWDEAALAVSVLSSDEYYAKHGSTANPFVISLYQNLLGRVPSPGEISPWVSLAATSRRNVVREFLSSEEYATRFVFQKYSQWLNRIPSQGETTPFVALAEQMNWRDISVTLLASEEYQSLNSVDAQTILQSCFDKGGDLALPSGRYYLGSQLKLSVPLNLHTQGITSDQPKCTLLENQDCAEIKALPSLVGMGLINGDLSGGSFDHIVINGNRDSRAAAYAAHAQGNVSAGYNLALKCPNGCTIENSVSKYAAFGTALGIATGKSMTLVSNTFAFNGRHNNGLWSDGLTISDASDSNISANEFIDNTDVNLILGGCARCKIQYNYVHHSGDPLGTAFAGLMIHAWPSLDAQCHFAGNSTSGDYTDSEISNNGVDGSSGHLVGFGILLGAGPWYPAYVKGGKIHDNWIVNAVYGLILADYHSASIWANSVSNTNSFAYFLSSHSDNIDFSRDSAFQQGLYVRSPDFSTPPDGSALGCHRH